MHNDKKLSVGIIAYNEEKSISTVVKGFKTLGIFDEIIVVNNNSTDRTAENAKNAGAKVVNETRQGYGYACQRALKECRGEIIVLTEGDASFESRDVLKFLSYIDDADMILGTRTTRELIRKNAKMNNFLLLGNLFLAKLIQLKFFGRVRLTDVGCTFRAIKKESLNKISGEFTVGSSHFSPEMIIIALRAGLRVVEIPINYRERMGESKITSNTKKSTKLGLKMMKLIMTR